MALVGRGSAEQKLSEEEVRDLCAEAVAQTDFGGKRVLFVIPDGTRTAPIDLMFRVVYDLLAERVVLLDFVIALGTHPPMSDEAIYERVGIGNREEHQTRYPKARFFNHRWKDRSRLRTIGTLTEEQIAEMSGGQMRQSVDVTINEMVFDYDCLIVVGPTFPHEVVGFSGGNKYLIPGIAGQEIIDLFHWLGALITSSEIIGTKHTPVRAVVDKAASFLPMERLCFSLVVSDLDLAGLYFGSPEQAWEAASDLSEKLHIVYKDRPYDSVLSRAPEMYDELWTGGKCMYKLEPVVADGGELIIYAPHIQDISAVHGSNIEQIGYHTRDYFTSQMERFADIPGGVLAHSTHVKGIGTCEDGVEKPRINVTLATQILPETCEKINLGYRDPATIDVTEWENREDEGRLYVPKAGEMLFRLKKQA
jgi:nickel-dependent lactate racemase